MELNDIKKWVPLIMEKRKACQDKDLRRKECCQRNAKIKFNY